MVRIRWYALPLVALPLYSIASSLEACSSGSNGQAGQSSSAITCEADETAKHLNQGAVCCKPKAGGMSCRAAGDTEPGQPCLTVGSTMPGSAYTASFDVCVEESCSGDRTCTEFPIRVEKQTGTLRCVSKGSSAEWEWDGQPSAHRVERACLVSGSRACGGAGYSTSTSTTSTYGPAYFSGYSAVCGYGYGAGPVRINERELYLMSSTCSASGAPASPCPVDNL